uniref:AlNc14C549G12129 protein n=1 Tax=Albugo laibachii Nc14 TaxID=890382 RepID=F0X137_9STRA|nr:AlNc14C549G12129 [Albugo laibachii Nc14]|eukprot:CCA27491.1 AlNc14C549G12129 [Albugo laibachii Nc14]
MSVLDRIQRQLESHADTSSTLLSDILERLNALETQVAECKAQKLAASRQELDSEINVSLGEETDLEFLAHEQDQENQLDTDPFQQSGSPFRGGSSYNITSIAMIEQSEVLQGVVHKLQEELQLTAMNVEKQLREADESFARINATCDKIMSKLMALQVRPSSPVRPRLETKVALGRHLDHMQATMLAKAAYGATQQAIPPENDDDPQASQDSTSGISFENTLVCFGNEVFQKDAPDLKKDEVTDYARGQIKPHPGSGSDAADHQAFNNKTTSFGMRLELAEESEAASLSKFTGSIDGTGLLMTNRTEGSLLYHFAQLEKQQARLELSLADIRRQLSGSYLETTSTTILDHKEYTNGNDFSVDWQSSVKKLRDEMLQVTKQFITKSDFHAFVQGVGLRKMDKHTDATMTRSTKNLKMSTAASRTFLSTPARTKLEHLDPLFVLTTSSPITKSKVNSRLDPLNGRGPSIELTGRRFR